MDDPIAEYIKLNNKFDELWQLQETESEEGLRIQNDMENIWISLTEDQRNILRKRLG